jgi:hypothetical protein
VRNETVPFAAKFLANENLLTRQLADGISRRACASSISHILCDFYLQALERIRNIHNEASRAMDAAGSEKRIRIARFALKDEGDILCLVDVALRGICDCLGIKPRMIIEAISRIDTDQHRAPADDLSEEVLDRLVAVMRKRMARTDHPGSTRGGQSPIMVDTVPQNRSMPTVICDGDSDQRVTLVRAIAERIVNDDADSLETAYALSELYIDPLQGILNVYAAVNQAHQLLEAGDCRWKAKYHRARLALRDEKKYLRLVDQAVRNISCSTGLKGRVRIQQIANIRAGPSHGKSKEEIRDDIHKRLMKMMILRARIYNMPIAWLSEIAEEAGVELDIPRGDAKQDK